MTETETLPALSTPKGINIEDIIYCVDTLKLSYQQKADKIGCSKPNIVQRLQHYGYKPGDLTKFQEHQADRYAIRRLRISKHLTEEKLKKMSAYQLVGMDSVTLNQERLIRGESTQNIAYADLTRDHDKLRAKRQALEKELGIVQEHEAP